MSGLRVNFSKSALIPIGEGPNVNVLASMYGCGVDYPPSSLLGLPLVLLIREAVWELVVERSHKRFTGSKFKILSGGG